VRRRLLRGVDAIEGGEHFVGAHGPLIRIFRQQPQYDLLEILRAAIR
jgi:hypothetical protein